jgi:hypothetical protein
MVVVVVDQINKVWEWFGLVLGDVASAEPQQYLFSQCRPSVPYLILPPSIQKGSTVLPMAQQAFTLTNSSFFSLE